MELAKNDVKNVIDTNELWPEPNYDSEIEPHFLFILTPPFSGSTAIANLLNTSERTTFLQGRAEGQWLIPGLCQNDRWAEKKSVEYNSVKSVWLNKYQNINQLEGKIDVVIEKSPPNMMRIMELVSCFKSFSIVANNRNPYANCASILYRSCDADNIGNEKRIESLSSIARSWIRRSIVIEKLISQHQIPLVTYEEFCKNPATLVEALSLPKGVAETININAAVKVKDYVPQKIVNQNDRQISKLTTEEIRHLTKLFVDNTGLMESFGYTVLAD